MKVQRITKSKLIAYCKTLGINTKGKNKSDLVNAVHKLEREQIEKAINEGSDHTLLSQKIKLLADEYASNLNAKIATRKDEMSHDNHEHYLIYRVLGISEDEGKLIDEYQNSGRFLYKYAGSFLEEATTLCLFFSNRNGGKHIIPNNQGSKPKTFEIDFLNGVHAIEIKWRDATTDGDHITKEHARVKAIESHGYIPVRMMFYRPQRDQAKRIQATLETIYKGVGGKYYAGEHAWQYLQETTGYNLKAILIEIADSKWGK